MAFSTIFIKIYFNLTSSLHNLYSEWVISIFDIKNNFFYYAYILKISIISSIVFFILKFVGYKQKIC